MVEWGDSGMLWLNVTNVALALATLTALVAILSGAGLELMARLKKRASAERRGQP